jgi:dihydrofolate reductase
MSAFHPLQTFNPVYSSAEKRSGRERCRAGCVESEMRQVIYGGAISLDGFLAGRGESVDWLRCSDESARLVAASFKGVDVMLMGRKTFEFAQRLGGGPPVKGVTTYVFSRTMECLPEGARGELVSEDAADFVRRMKNQPGGKILVMGGGELGSALIEAGLVDEIGFSIHPTTMPSGLRPSATVILRSEPSGFIE